VSDLTIGLLGALLATNQPTAISNVIQQQTGIAVPVENQNDPTENELRTVMMDDDAAQAEVNSWISTNSISPTNTVAKIQFNQRIMARFDEVRKGYEDFLRNHPDNAHGFLAYGSFLNDIGDEDAAKVQYENSKQLDPKNPAVWNNLANYYGEHGPITNAFADYTEAIRLDPNEPVYYQNFATTVYLYRTDVKEFYHLNEQQTFDKALGLYQQAMSLDPSNLVLATDYAESYYGIKPLRTNDALVAWTNALNIAQDENEREGVRVHLARVKISAGFYDDAQTELDAITNAAFADMKTHLERSLNDHKNPPTNSVAENLTNNVVVTTNAAITISNSVAALTNSLSAPTNEILALTNSVSLSTNLEVAPADLTNHVPPPPKPQ
jgi:tetratricopeptide (TPR) repeat protein